MAEQPRIRIAIAGASGYVGAELLRLALDHPRVDIALVSSERHAGVPVGHVLHSLRNHPAARDLRFRPLADIAAAGPVDVAFGCLPGGELPALMPLLAEHAKTVVNLAGDFRLRDPELAARHYPASATWDLPFGYHVPELSPVVAGQRFLNLPGCMAVATIYALYPLLARGLTVDDIVVDAKTGSSGSGRTSSDHPAERVGNFRVHKLHGHRHGPEVEQAVSDLTGRATRLQFSTFSLDVARGIVVSAYARLAPGVTDVDVRRAYAQAYSATPFVRMRAGNPRSAHSLPMVKSVVGSNVAEVAAQVRDGRCVTVAALDNLIKGAAGQAVQTMNQLFGLDEALGLPFTAMAP